MTLDYRPDFDAASHNTLTNCSDVIPVDGGYRTSYGAAAAANTGLTLGAWHVVCEVINGANSSITVDNGTPTTGDAGANNPGGITLFSNAAGAGYFNGMIKELIDFPILLDATQRARVIHYAMGRHGIS